MKRRIHLLAAAVLVAASSLWLSVASQAQTPGNNGPIAFERVNVTTGETDIYGVDPSGGQPQILWPGGSAPHWSPDGTTLAFLTCLDPPTCDTAVALLDPATGAVHGFSMPDPDLFTPCVVWSADGTRLACEGQSETHPNLNGIYTIRASDGGGLTRITSNAGGDDLPLDYSPDGTRLVFARQSPDRPPQANHALFVANSDGQHAHRITPWGFTDDQASWSPDGSRIVFATSGSLYRVRPDGSGLAKITPDTTHGTRLADEFDVGWSPDGTRLVFSARPQGSQQSSLYTASDDGRDLQELTSSPTEDHHANWGSTPAP